VLDLAVCVPHFCVPCSGVNVMFWLESFVKTSVFNSAASELLLIMEDMDDSFGTASGLPPGAVPLEVDAEKRIIAVTASTTHGTRVVRNVPRTEADAIVNSAGSLVSATVCASFGALYHIATMS
jgi:hypothetical protein